MEFIEHCVEDLPEISKKIVKPIKHLKSSSSIQLKLGGVNQDFRYL